MQHHSLTAQHGNALEKVKASKRTIFLGGIPLQARAKDILNYLASFDVVESLRLPKDPATGRLKGFAKAVLASVEGAERISFEPNHYILGLKVGISQWKDSLHYVKEKKGESRRKVYVKYPRGLSPTLLFHYFSQFGDIENVDHKRNPQTNKQRFFCYVTFTSQDAAQMVLQNKEHLIAEYLVTCELSKPMHGDKYSQDAHKQSPGIQKTRNEFSEIGDMNHKISKNSTTHPKVSQGDKWREEKYSSHLDNFPSKHCINAPIVGTQLYEGYLPADNNLNPVHSNEWQHQEKINFLKGAPSSLKTDFCRQEHLQHQAPATQFPIDLLAMVGTNHKIVNNLRFNVGLRAPRAQVPRIHTDRVRSL